MPEQTTGQTEMNANIEPEMDVELPKRSYHLRVMRHAERLPSGELRPEGIEKARAFGGTLSESAVVKGYASKDEADRTLRTANLVSEASGVTSPRNQATLESEENQLVTAEFSTRRVPDIGYDMIEPAAIAGIRSYIDQLAVDEIGARGLWPVDGLDIRKLPPEVPDDIKIAIGEIRQSKQAQGFELLMQNPSAVHRMAMGIAHQLVNKLHICQRLERRERTLSQPRAQGNVDINIVTYGMFGESVLVSAGNSITEDGMKKIDDIKSVGGFFAPTESWYLDIPDLANVPEQIPVIFEGENRPARGAVFIEKSRLEALEHDYTEWKEAQGQENRDEIAS